MDAICLQNQTIINGLKDRQFSKEAADIVEDYTRTEVREGGFTRQLLTFKPMAREKLVKQLDSDQPYFIMEKEVGSTGAATVPYNTAPEGVYLRGNRYPVAFARIMSPMASKDTSELLTYSIDLRSVIGDKYVKDILAEEDGRFLDAVDAALQGPDVVLPYSGVAQWQTMSGGLDRDSWQETLAVMENTPSRLSPTRVLMNNITNREFLKMGFDEFGGDKSQDLLVNGWTFTEFSGVQVIKTIKHELVPHGTIYAFADERFLGVAYELQAVTMFNENRGPMINFYYYEEIGASLGHFGGLARVDHE